MIRRFVEEVPINKNWDVYDELNAEGFVNTARRPGFPMTAKAERCTSARSCVRFRQRRSRRSERHRRSRIEELAGRETSASIDAKR